MVVEAAKPPLLHDYLVTVVVVQAERMEAMARRVVHIFVTVGPQEMMVDQRWRRCWAATDASS